jgi:RNA polymerase sigma-70 factor (ECF subfamily)
MSAVSLHELSSSEPSDDARSFVAAVQAGAVAARAALYDRHAPDIARILHAVLGPDSEIADLIQETFIEAFNAIGTLRDADALSAWLRQIAVNVARTSIRRRRRLRFLHRLGLADAVEPPDTRIAPPEVRQAVAETYRVLDELPADLRVVFSLRYIDGLELTQVAAACGVSLATVKRRLASADASFRKHARRRGKLEDWVGL